MSYTYHLRTDFILDEEGNKHIVYGVSAIQTDGTILMSVSDVFFDAQQAKAFVACCNQYEVSLIHLMDVIDDALTEQYAL